MGVVCSHQHDHLASGASRKKEEKALFPSSLMGKLVCLKTFMSSRNSRKERTIYFLFFFPLLLTTLISCANSGQAVVVQKMATPTKAATVAPCTDTNGSGSEGNPSQIAVKIDSACTIGTSQYASGLTQIDNSLDYPETTSQVRAANKITSLLTGTVTYQNTHIMGWGMPDPWPDPTTPDPTDWSGLDLSMHLALATGSQPVITLDEAPWWMKGEMLDDGSTQTLVQSDEWSGIAYRSRILDNKMDAWVHLVQSVARRYMVPPYNVRYFQVWNELKGYYNPLTNNFDYINNAGNPNGPFATHGYTYMYNRVYEALMSVATSLGIAPNDIKVGGPYVFMDAWSDKTQSTASAITGPFGTLDQRPLDTIQYWLQHKDGAGFIAFDGSAKTRDVSTLQTNPCKAAEVFGYVTSWIRSLDPTKYPGAKTLPIWMSEWFLGPYNGEQNFDYDNMVKTCAMIKFIVAGGGVALSWGGADDAALDMGLYTSDGTPHPWYWTMRSLKTDFAAGTKLYLTTVSDPNSVLALASDRNVLLVNKTSHTLTLAVRRKQVSLAPYAVTVVGYN